MTAAPGYGSPKPPDSCASLDDVRAGIDDIDRRIVEALGRRLAYVERAAHFKPTEASIQAPERVSAMVAQRRLWASENGLDPDFVGPLFAQIAHWYIARQVRHWRTMRDPRDDERGGA